MEYYSYLGKFSSEAFLLEVEEIYHELDEIIKSCDYRTVEIRRLKKLEEVANKLKISALRFRGVGDWN